MSTLQENLDAIKLDKDTNLKPENLKKNVTCLGITGTYEGSGGGTVEGVKQFSTMEQMQNSTGNKEGDLAVVYRSEIQNATVDSKFQVATFPDTVVLDTAITRNVEVRYRAVDSSKMFDCMGSLDSSRFSMDCYSETGEIRIQYTSSDGITYTRTDTTGNPVDFGTEVYYEMTEMWNDAIGKFIQVGGSTFEGLYKNKIITRNNHKETVQNPRVEGGIMVYDTKGEFDITPYASNLAKFCQENDMSDFCFICGIKNDIAKLYYIKDERMTPVVVNYNDKLHYGIVRNRNTIIESPNHIQIDLITGNISFAANSNTPNIMQVDQRDWIEVFDEVEVDTYLVADLFRPSTSDLQGNIDLFYYYKPYDGTSSYRVYCKLELIPEQLYLLAPTQLSAIADYVYEKEFYGKNGVETGTLAQNVSNSFIDNNAIIYHKIQMQYDDMEPRVLTDDDKTIDKSIYLIPIKSDGTPLLDTSSVTAMYSMFESCTNLTTIPLLNTSSVTNMRSMFQSCTNLTEIPQLDTSSVTNMTNMFGYCTNLATIPLLNTSSVTNMGGMFWNCTNLTTIPLLDTSSVTNMDGMFSDCTNLTEIPQLNTSSVTNMDSMFASCTNLTEIPQLNTSRVTSMYGMFTSCTNLTEIPLLDTGSVTNMYNMFYGCTNLTTIPLLNTSSVTNMRSMFYGCTSLSDESLNNILAMCTNATSYTSTKRLNYIGLTSDQATKCTTLSNYSAFTAAGWTTGY